MLLAGNPLIKIEASSLFSIYMGKSVAYGKQNSVLKNFMLFLFVSVSVAVSFFLLDIKSDEDGLTILFLK